MIVGYNFQKPRRMYEDNINTDHKVLWNEAVDFTQGEGFWLAQEVTYLQEPVTGLN